MQPSGFTDRTSPFSLRKPRTSYAEHDDFLVKVPALKELLCRGGFRHRWPLAPQSQLFRFSPEPSDRPRNAKRELCRKNGVLKRRLEQAGLPAHYLPHSFRATGITNFLENDGTLEAAQQIASHGDSRTTKLYDRRGKRCFSKIWREMPSSAFRSKCRVR